MQYLVWKLLRVFLKYLLGSGMTALLDAFKPIWNYHFCFIRRLSVNIHLRKLYIQFPIFYMFFKPRHSFYFSFQKSTVITIDKTFIKIFNLDSNFKVRLLYLSQCPKWDLMNFQISRIKPLQCEWVRLKELKNIFSKS